MLARGKRECDRGHALRGAALGVLAAILAAGSAGAVLPPPTGLDASVDSCWGVRLSWDDLPGADSFEVRRGETVFHTIDLFFRDTGAPEGFSDYWVAGIDSDGAGERASATGRRLAVPNTPASFLASDTSCTLVRLSWDAAADADSYRVSRGGLLLATLPSTILFYEDTAPPGRYGYALSAGNACGWSGAAVDSGTVLSPPAPPAGLSASDTICGLVRLSWTAAAHADSFDVYRNSARIASVAGTEFEDVPSPGTYAYEVAARNSCGESSRAADSGTRPPDAPLAPSNPAASDTSCHFILLTWEDVADEEGYRIRRDGAPIATLPPGTTFYQDAAVASGTAHAYRIEAFNGCGGSFSSEVIGERIFGYPDPPNDVQASDALCDSVFVSWTYPGAPGQLDSFQVLFRAPGGPGWTRAGAVLPNAGPHFGFGHAQSSGSWEYRVAAFNSCGSSPASEGSTDDAEALTSPSVPAFFAASDSLCSRVELEWSASADADTYVVFRDGALLARVLAPALSYVDEPITGTHAYALRAANRCGRSAERTDAAYARPRPSPPANVSASTDSCGLIRIEWQGAPSDTGYYLYRDGAFLAKTPAGVFFFRDTGAPPGPHAYRVGALDICGRSDSIAANGIRPPDAPAAPSAFSATDNVCGAVFLSWSAVLDADSFYVYRDSIRIAKTAGTAFQDIPPVGTYRYEVSARNRCGEGPRAADTGVRPPDAPAAPLNLAASDAVCGAIEITWSAAANAEGYRVLRDGIHLADAGATFYSDFSAAPGSSYVYTANAWNGCGESGESAPDIGRRPWDAPEAPGGVSASFGRCDGVEIDWLDVIGEDGFVVERNGTILDTLESGETSYLDAAAPGGISLSYRVGAFNACGPVPSFSAPASGFRLPPPAVPASLDADSICGGVRLRWTDVSWEDGYAIARDGAVIDTAEADASEYIDAGATPGTAHEYAVGSFNACLAAPSFTSPVVGVRPYDAPAAPLSVSATDDLCGEIRISWIVSAHADSHRVFRNGAWIATVKGNAIIDTQAPPGTYAYTVRAKNFCGESVSSAPEAGTRLPDAPAAPTNPAASDTSCHFVLVTWGDVANEQGYRVFRDGQPIADLAANTTLFRDAFVGSGSPHSYQVQSYNSCGSAFSVAVLGERILGYPDPPVQVTASDSYCDRVTVTWVFTGGAVDSFAVSYRDTAALGWTLAGSASSSARMFTHVPAAGTYEYLVQAHNSCGASPEAAWSKDVGTRKRAPSAPAFLASSDREVCGNREFRLRWNRVAGAARYVVLDGSVEHDVGTDTTYASTKTAAGSYSFRVRAENSCGQSPTSSPWTVEVQASASAPTGVVSSNNLCGAIRISWTPSSASNVWIEREGSRVYVSGTGSWTDSLPAGGSRTYAVGGWNSCDTLGASAQPAGFAYPLAIAAPVGVQATRGLCDSVRVVWSYFPEQTGVDSFRVLRMEGPITSTVAVVPAGAPREAADRNVSTGTIYVYKVRAESPCAQAIWDLRGRHRLCLRAPRGGDLERPRVVGLRRRAVPHPVERIGGRRALRGAEERGSDRHRDRERARSRRDRNGESPIPRRRHEPVRLRNGERSMDRDGERGGRRPDRGASRHLVLRLGHRPLESADRQHPGLPLGPSRGDLEGTGERSRRGLPAARGDLPCPLLQRMRGIAGRRGGSRAPEASPRRSLERQRDRRVLRFGRGRLVDSEPAVDSGRVGRDRAKPERHDHRGRVEPAALAEPFRRSGRLGDLSLRSGRAERLRRVARGSDVVGPRRLSPGCGGGGVRVLHRHGGVRRRALRAPVGAGAGSSLLPGPRDDRRRRARARDRGGAARLGFPFRGRGGPSALPRAGDRPLRPRAPGRAADGRRLPATRAPAEPRGDPRPLRRGAADVAGIRGLRGEVPRPQGRHPDRDRRERGERVRRPGGDRRNGLYVYRPRREHLRRFRDGRGGARLLAPGPRRSRAPKPAGRRRGAPNPGSPRARSRERKGTPSASRRSLPARSSSKRFFLRQTPRSSRRSSASGRATDGARRRGARAASACRAPGGRSARSRSRPRRSRATPRTARTRSRSAS